MKEHSSASLEFYQSLANSFAYCPRGNVLASPKIAKFHLSHEQFIVYITIFNELCLRLPRIIHEVPFLDISTQYLSIECDLSPQIIDSALKSIKDKGLIDYTKNSDNLHIYVHDISVV